MTIVYYRWTYSPTTGDVTLAHNHEGQPADIRLHGEMIGDRPESDIECGYAYRLDGGWKLTDEDHKPFEDPHAVQQIQEAIDGYEDGDSNPGV